MMLTTPVGEIIDFVEVVVLCVEVSVMSEEEAYESSRCVEMGESSECSGKVVEVGESDEMCVV